MNYTATDINKRVRIGADVGGTFTDVILVDATDKVWTHKVPSTPPDFERAILHAIEHLLERSRTEAVQIDEIAHGTTVATNAVLERQGAHTALVTTAGFRDVLELRRIRAPQIYNLFWDKPPQLVDRGLRFELNERIASDGKELIGVDSQQLHEIGKQLQDEKIESLAVCLLHAYAYPEHEQIVGDFLRRRFPGMPISLSHEILPERKEYERTATTVVNAYVRPVMRRYLNALRQGLENLGSKAPLLIMQSAGGLTPEADAAERPVFVLESGPAAGVLAACSAAKANGINNVVTLDMGGTTAKASIVENGTIEYSPEYEVGSSLSAGNRLLGGGGELIRAPSIDIAEVGAGGGSIAYLDRAGGLRVGPRSAGAMPGPVCYGRGGSEPTLTDANVVLGYIRPGKLADGEISIDKDLATQIILTKVAHPLELELLVAADGIHRIANARTMRALRSVSTERGRDPRDFALMAFGGAGPIHAADLARELKIGTVMIPPCPGLFSSIGLLCSGTEHHEVRSCLLSGEQLTRSTLSSIQEEIDTALLKRFQSEGYDANELELLCSVDMRFKGQASEIRINVPTPVQHNVIAHLVDRFGEEHERLYGHRSDPDNPIEIITVRGIGRTGERKLLTQEIDTGDVMTSNNRNAYFGQEHGSILTPVVRRVDLDKEIDGPLLIDEYDSTVVIPPGMRVQRDDQNNIVIKTEIL